MNMFESVKSLLKLYFFLTIFTYLFDFVEFIIQLVRFGRPGDVSSIIFNKDYFRNILE